MSICFLRFCREIGWHGSVGSLVSVTRCRSRVSRSVIYPSRLETRTKESNMCASRSVLIRLERRNESKSYDPESGGP